MQTHNYTPTPQYAVDGTKTWSLVFSYMHLLLKAANHMALLIPDSRTKQRQVERAKSVCELAFREHAQFVELTRSAAFRTLSDPQYCGKMKVLQGLLSVFSSAHDKVLLFSYSTKLLDIIEQYVISEGHEYRRIDGKVNSRRRRNIVHQFNKDKNIFLCLISTKAGGLGLNLTGANKVVIFDPNWNPSHDLQAQDRAYRIGQTRDVKVYRLVCAGTIEENIYLRQIYKQQLDEVAVGTRNARRYFLGIQGDRDNQGELFGVKNLFSLRTGDSCLTMDILKRNEKLEKGLAGYDITHYIPAQKEMTADMCHDDDEKEEEEQGEYGGNKNLIDSEAEEEEDWAFLQEMFGTVRSPRKSTFKTESIQKPPVLSGKEPAPISNIIQNSDGSESEEEFSFIPKLHNRGSHKEKVKNESIEVPGMKSFTVKDLTFSNCGSKFVGESSSVKSFNENAGQSRSLKSLPAFSWLFDDSDDSGDEEENLKRNKRKKNDNEAELNISKRDITTSYQSHDNDGSIKVTPQHDGISHLVSSRNTKESDARAEGSSHDGKSKFSSVQSVFDECCVLHTHVNNKVVGSSRAEDHMTHCAIQEVFQLQTNTQAPAMECDPFSEPEEEEKDRKKGAADKEKRGKRAGLKTTSLKKDHNTPSSVKMGSVRLLLGQTPAAIKRQQWSELCKWKNADQLELAEKLLTCDAASRLEVLREFYCHCHPTLTDAFSQVLCVKSDFVSSKSSDKKQTADATTPACPTTKRHSHKSDNRDEKRKSLAIERRSKTSDPPRSSSSRKKSKRRPASALSDWQNIVLESQESITAVTPLNPDSSFSGSFETFEPVPQSHRKKHLSKFSPLKKHMRLRQRAIQNYGKGGERSSFIDNKEGASFFQETSIDPSLCVASMSTAVDACSDQTGDKDETILEDIPSLLHELGQREFDERKMAGSVVNSACRSTDRFCGRTDPNDSTLKSQKFGAKVQVHNASTTTPKKSGENKRRGVASLLDDIFFNSQNSTSEEEEETKSSKKPFSTYTETTLLLKQNTPTKKSKICGRDFEENITASAGQSTKSGTVIPDFDDLDSFLTVNTLKEIPVKEESETKSYLDSVLRPARLRDKESAQFDLPFNKGDQDLGSESLFS